jgi:hypothetical protein
LFFASVIFIEMVPVNIKIQYQAKEVTLTVIAEDGALYRLLYYGGILGAVERSNNIWILSDPSKVPSGDLPQYRKAHQNNRVELALDNEVANQIGRKIEDHLLRQGEKLPVPSPTHLRSIRE